MLITEETNFIPGKYQVTVEANGGTAELQQSVDGLAFQSIPDASWSADTVAVIDIAWCTLKPVLTGGAVMSIKKIQVAERFTYSA